MSEKILELRQQGSSNCKRCKIWIFCISPLQFVPPPPPPTPPAPRKSHIGQERLTLCSFNRYREDNQDRIAQNPAPIDHNIARARKTSFFAKSNRIRSSTNSEAEQKQFNIRSMHQKASLCTICLGENKITVTVIFQIKSKGMMKRCKSNVHVCD